MKSVRGVNILSTARVSPTALAVITIIFISIMLPGLTSIIEIQKDHLAEPNQSPPPISLPVKSFRADEFGNDTLVIEGEYFVDNKNWELNKNLFVEEGASLILNSTDLFINTGQAPKWIYVSTEAELVMRDAMIDVDPLTNSYAYSIIINGELDMENSTINSSGISKIYDYQDWETEYSFILENAVGRINNSIFSYNKNILVINSSLTVSNSMITNHSVGFIITNSTFIVDSCRFLNNYNDLYIYLADDFKITNSTFDFYSYDTYNVFRLYNAVGIVAWASTGIIQDCLITGKHYGTQISDSVIEIINNAYLFNFESVRISNGELTVENCNFEFLVKTGDIPLEYVDFIVNEFAVSGYNSVLYIGNSTFMNYTTGVALTYSTLSVFNCTISNSYVGIDCSLGGLFCDYLNINNNDIGIFMSQSRGRVLYSTVSSNGIGIRLHETEMLLIDNEIIDNERWGVIHEGYGWDLEFEGENFYSAVEDSSSTNGLGNLARTYRVKAEVYDLFNISIFKAKVELENSCIETYSVQGDFYFEDGIYTDSKGQCLLGELIEFVMIDGYEKIYCDDYTITASYEVNNNLIVNNRTLLKLDGSYKGEMIRFILPLPNYSIDTSTFELSKDNLKRGDILKVSAVINYAGPVSFDLPPVKVSLFIDNKRISSVDVTNLSEEGGAQVVEFNWEAENQVSYPFRVDQRRIAIKIEPEDDIEYPEAVYEDDNYISTYVKIDVEARSPSDSWAFSSSSPLALGLFLRGIVALISVILISLWWFFIRKPMKPGNEDEVEGVDKIEDKQKEGLRRPGRGIPRHRESPVRPGGPGRPSGRPPDRFSRPIRPDRPGRQFNRRPPPGFK
jgi:hypothetical protein